MEVKIGVQHAPREILLESAQEQDAVLSAVTKALTNGSLLQLEDERGRRIIVPAGLIAYVEVGEAVERRVGFGAI